jgi:hypothetical protein
MKQNPQLKKASAAADKAFVSFLSPQHYNLNNVPIGHWTGECNRVDPRWVAWYVTHGHPVAVVTGFYLNFSNQQRTDARGPALQQCAAN